MTDELYGDKEFANVGFPTPTDIPEDTACRTLKIPASSAWLGVVMGCLYGLTDPANWQQFDGGITSDEAADRAAEMIEQAYDDITEACTGDDLAPYWENTDDIEGAPPPGEQQNWWGVFDGLTFQQSLENAFIAAYVGILAGADKAVQFLVIARKFRLQFESDPYGGILDILINREHYGYVDTYAPEPIIISQDVIIPPTMGFTTLSEDRNELLIVNTGTANPLATPTPDGYTMRVVRKRLTEDELDAVIDVRTVGGQVEILRNDDAGWVSVPNAVYVRVDGSLDPDMTGQFKVKPSSDTPAGVFQRALTAASSDILQAQTEAGVTLTAIEPDGTLAFRNSAIINRIRASGSTFDIRFGSNSPFSLTSTLLSIEAGLAVIGSPLRQQARISGTLVDQLRFLTGWDNSTLATRRARVDMGIADAAAYRVFFSASSSGTAPQIAFLGKTPEIARPTISGSDGGSTALQNLLTALANYGLITNSTTHISSPAIVGVRQSDSDSCILESTTDGTTWTDFADLSLCIPPPTGTRYNVDCDCIEDTHDGGETWVETPLSDPRTSPVYMTILPSDGKCNSAASMVRYTRNMIDRVLLMIDSTTLAVDALALITTLLVTLGPFGVFAVAILAFWTLCVGTGSVVIAEEFSEEVYDLLLCIFYIHLEDDGTLTDAGLAAVYADIDALIASADVRAILHAMYGIMGFVGLTSAGGLGLDTDYCGDCQCDDNDLQVTDGMYSPHDGTYAASGTWVDGAGWRVTYDSAAGLYRLNAWRTCHVTGANWIKGIITTNVNSVAGVKITRISDGAVWCDNGAANTFVVDHGDLGAFHLIDPGTGNPGTLTGDIYVEIRASSVGTVTFNEVQIYA